jgi:outer membrane protein, adhesin transport system
MKLRLIISSFILLIFCQANFSQKQYGLKDCIGIGLEKNFSIRVARNNESVSNNNFTVGNAGFLPTVSVNSRYAGAVTNSTQVQDDGSKNVTNGTATNLASASAALSMTIFNGFSVLTTYKKLGELKQIGELNTQLTIENYIATIVSVYSGYIQQLQQLSNLRYAVTLSRERLRIDEERYLLGSSSKLQVLQSRVYLNSDSSRYENQVQSTWETHIRLNELMAMEDIGLNFSLADTTISVNPTLLYEKLLDETLAANTNLQIAAKNTVISEYDKKLAVSRSYPYLDLNGGYGYSFSTNTTSSYKNQQTNGPTFGLTLGMTIFDGLNIKRQINNSVIDIKTKELKYAELEQGIRADLLSIYSAYQNYLKLIKLEEQNLSTATENLSIAMERYRLGNLSGLDLREVQKSLLDARERLLSVQYQAKLAEISLLQISGRIMEYYR